MGFTRLKQFTIFKPVKVKNVPIQKLFYCLLTFRFNSNLRQNCPRKFEIGLLGKYIKSGLNMFNIVNIDDIIADVNNLGYEFYISTISASEKHIGASCGNLALSVSGDNSLTDGTNDRLLTLIDNKKIGEKQPSPKGDVYIFQTKDKYKIESISLFNPFNVGEEIYWNDITKIRWFFDISCWSGCPCGCKFCVSNSFDKCRKLTSDEMIEQLEFMLSQHPEYDVNSVHEAELSIDRMGEPALNWENVKKFCEYVKEKYPNIRIMISTIGIKNTDYSWISGNMNLMISLHSFNEYRRNKLLPYRNKMTFKELSEIEIGKCYSKADKHDIKITLNLVMLSNLDYDRNVLLKYFGSDKFFIRFTELYKNPCLIENKIVQENGMKLSLKHAYKFSYHERMKMYIDNKNQKNTLSYKIHHLFGYDTDPTNETDNLIAQKDRHFINMKNTCDYTCPNQIEVDFTLNCDNRCSYCYNQKYLGSKIKPQYEKIAYTVLNILAKDQSPKVLSILGGEPLLYIDELLEFVKIIKENTNLKILVTSTLPATCITHWDKFIKILNIIDELHVSAHSYDQRIGDISRNSTSKHDRNKLLRDILNADITAEVSVHLNLAKDIISTRAAVFENYEYYNALSSTTAKKLKYIRFTEIQLDENLPVYKDFEKIMDIKLPAPYSNGCYQNITKLMNGDTPCLLKRTCFLVTRHKTIESFKDILKLLYKVFYRKKREHLVYIVNENGELKYERKLFESQTCAFSIEK